MNEFVRRLRGDAPPPAPEELHRARREAERQLEWVEAYLAAVEGIELHDPRLTLEAGELRLAVRAFRARLGKPRVL